MHSVLFASTLIGAALALGACGGGSGSTSLPVANPSPAPTSSAASATTTGFSGDAKQAQINGSTVFIDASTGLALYFFNGDGTNQSNCTGSCLVIWPAHAASSNEKGDGNFSIITRPDGSLQWAYKGRPLYTFVSDTTAHNATGNGVQNFVLATP